MCILSVYTLLKVAGYYDLDVLSMSVMGFQKIEVWMGGGWGEIYPSFFGDFWNLFNFAKPLTFSMRRCNKKMMMCHTYNFQNDHCTNDMMIINAA